MLSNPKPTERRFMLCTNEVVRYQYLHLYPESHIVGELFRYIYDGEPVTALFFYINPVSASVVPPIRPVFGPRMVADADVPCLFPGCGKLARWKMGRSARKVLYKDHKETDEYIDRKT